jgi:PST family polysaccharide transporter
MSSLKHGSIRSAYVWASAGNITKAAVTFWLSVVLARLLQPSDYGLIGVAVALIEILLVIQDAGFGNAVVYFDENPEALPTYFSLTIVTSAVLALLLFVAAPALAWFYSMPQLTWVIRVMAFSLVLGGLRSVSLGLVSKRLRFREIAAIETISGLIAGVTAVILAWRGAGVWSLVANMVVGSVLQTALTCSLEPVKLTTRPDRSVVRRVLRWGGPFTGTRILFQLYLNSDSLIVAKILGQTPLGHYSYGLRLARFLGERIFSIVNRASFPSFASLKNDKGHLIHHWFTLTQLLALIGFPAMLALAMNARDFVGVVLGEKWLPAVIPLQLLCISEAVRSIQTVLPPLLSSQGRPDLPLRYTAISLTALPVSFAAACLAGQLRGVAIVWCTVYPLLVLYLLNHALKVTGASFSAYFRNLRWPLFVTGCSAAAMLPFDFLMNPGLTRLVARSAAGGVCFIAVMSRVPIIQREVRKLLKLPERRVAVERAN